MNRMALILISSVALAADLELVEPQPLSVDQNGAAAATLTFHNGSSAPIELKPVLADFQHERDGKHYILRTATTWTPAGGTVPPKQYLSLKLNVTNIWEAGISKAVLRNGGQNIAVVDAGTGQTLAPGGSSDPRRL